MNKLKLIFSLFIGILAFASCSSTDDESEETAAIYAYWQAKNEAYFDDVWQQATDSIMAGKNNWYKIVSWSKSDTVSNHNSYIIVKVLSQRDNHDEVVNGLKNTTYSPCPTYKDSVTVTYRGNLIPFDEGTSSAEIYNSVIGPDNFKVGYCFDTKYFGTDMDIEEAVFTKFTPAGVVDGFTTALMYMHPQDRWRIFVPYTLGYGSTDNTTTSIPAYSVLIFDLYMKEFTTNQK